MILDNADYEIVYKQGTDDEVKFIAKLLTVREVKVISGFLGQSKDVINNNVIDFSLKLIELSIISWDNVFDKEGNKIEYNIDNLNKMPYDIFNFLVENIMEKNNLSKKDDEKIKNS